MHALGAAASVVPEKGGGARWFASSHSSRGVVAYMRATVKPGKGRDVVELGRPVNGARVVN